jgi:oligopeptide/dipeptide ABC transporter ATP-binding protein
MAGMATSLLSVRDLVVRYPGRGRRTGEIVAVRGVNIDIAPATILAVVGESGSGKTSLARAILQLQPIASGRVLLSGEDLAALSPQQLRAARRDIQAVFQDPMASLSPRRSVLQSLIEPLDHFRIGAAGEREDRAVAALETVGLDPALRYRLPHELSGGQRQRVALARALVSGPRLIIADEPLSSLDVPSQVRIVDLLLELRDRLGVAFLFVSHDLSVVRRLADAVAVMYLGTVVETAPARALFAAAAHPYTRALLAASPAPDPRLPRPLVLPGEPPSALTPTAGCVFHKRCSERLARCAAEEPAQSNPGSLEPHHSVRCFLWNA